MARASRLYVPLDVGFFDDEKVIQAGEKAGWLYLHMLTKAKLLDTDGALSKGQISKLGIPGWPGRLRDLIATGLVVELPMQRDTYVIAAWYRWNESKEARDLRLAEDRERKRRKTGAVADAE
jgi:hypothetical protein